MNARVQPAVDHSGKSSRALVDQCLANIHDRSGEGAATFTRVYDEAARACADFADQMQRHGIEAPPLAGLPVSIKDLFDVRGETTLAGSKALVDAAPAPRDAEIVRRLRRAGAVIVGKTNMTEFAFSGLGINPHYGTPSNPWRRDQKRIPGGSSSGAGVSVIDGMALVAIGTDTGGSVRIPAALCGIVGFKPTARTVPTDGALPLSTTFDSIGPLAHDVATCAKVYDVLRGAEPQPIDVVEPASITAAVATNYVLDQMDSTVAGVYRAALDRLSTAGVRLKDTSFPVLDELPSLFTHGGIVAAEALAWHQPLIAEAGDLYDPRVRSRIERGRNLSAADYVTLRGRRQQLVEQWGRETSSIDVVVMPTVPIVAPMISELADEDAYTRANMLVLRNPTVVNALDGCAITLPCHEPGTGPVGLMLACPGGRDRKLLAVAAALEGILSGS